MIITISVRILSVLLLYAVTSLAGWLCDLLTISFPLLSKSFNNELEIQTLNMNTKLI